MPLAEGYQCLQCTFVMCSLFEEAAYKAAVKIKQARAAQYRLRNTLPEKHLAWLSVLDLLAWDLLETVDQSTLDQQISTGLAHSSQKSFSKFRKSSPQVKYFFYLIFSLLMLLLF